MTANTNDLSEPLLLPTTTITTKQDDDEDGEKEVFLVLEGTTTLIKLFIFTTGCCIAILSQCILTSTLWSDSIVLSDTLHIILFSLHWSFWTCIIVFTVMMFIVNFIIDEDKHDNNTLFQIELLYVIGVIFMIFCIWCFHDYFELTILQIMIATIGILTLNTIIAYCVYNKGHKKSNNNNNNNVTTSSSAIHYRHTFCAIICGFLSGLSSQFTLAIFLWEKEQIIAATTTNNNYGGGILDNVVTFSLIWSIGTVIFTFIGCVCMRILCFNNNNQKQYNNNNNPRIILRMEALYIGTSLIGICSAWIFMDIYIMNMPEQVLPSIIMLIVSLFAFTVILKCFPEDKCLILEDIEEDEFDNQDDVITTSCSETATSFIYVQIV